MKIHLDRKALCDAVEDDADDFMNLLADLAYGNEDEGKVVKKLAWGFDPKGSQGEHYGVVGFLRELADALVAVEAGGSANAG